MKRVFFYATAIAMAAPSVMAAGSSGAVPSLGGYADMCIKAADLPASYGGESDLKGNPKLGAYCSCFSDKFTARLLKTDPSKTPSAEQDKKEQWAMRQSCREQVGLPPPPAMK